MTAGSTTRSHFEVAHVKCQHIGAQQSNRDGESSGVGDAKVLPSTVCTSNAARVIKEIKAHLCQGLHSQANK